MNGSADLLLETGDATGAVREYQALVAHASDRCGGQPLQSCKGL